MNVLEFVLKNQKRDALCRGHVVIMHVILITAKVIIPVAGCTGIDTNYTAATSDAGTSLANNIVVPLISLCHQCCWYLGEHYLGSVSLNRFETSS